MKLKIFILLSAVLIGSASWSNSVVAVQDFDLNRYLGKWYEISRIPNRFERNCVGVTAEYALRPDGKVSVLNTCKKGNLDAPSRVANGIATLVEGAKLTVTFTPLLPFIKGDYWVLYIADDYSLAVVGEPERKFGWVLSRTPQISNQQLARANQALVQNGYDPKALNKSCRLRIASNCSDHWRWGLQITDRFKAYAAQHKPLLAEIW